MLLINDRTTLLKSATLKSNRHYSAPAVEKRRVELPREIVPAPPRGKRAAPRPACAGRRSASSQWTSMAC